MLPISDLRNLGIDKLDSKELEKVYREAICIKDNLIIAFYREVDNVKGFWEVKNVSFEAKDVELSNETDLIGVYNFWYLFFEKITSEPVDDPQIRSIAVEFSNPKICFRAKKIDECLAIYAERLKVNASCYYISNETLKERCFEFILNLTKRE